MRCQKWGESFLGGESWAKGGWGEKAKTEIINLLPPEGFPVHLDTEDQGRFFLGYYHQKADNMKLNQNEAEQAE